jgi:hypothetical protein
MENELGLWKKGDLNREGLGIRVAANTLLSSFFMVTRSRDFSEWPVGAMK